MVFRSMRASAANDLAALANGKHGGTIDVIPKPFNCRMRSPPLGFEGFNFSVGEFIRLELAPRMQTALVPERQIASLTYTALRRILGEGAGWNAINLARGLAQVRLVARIAGGIKSAVGVELSHPSPAIQAKTRLSIELKSAPISTCPEAALIIDRLQSPTTASGREYSFFTCS